jgi:hypothetical protein
MLVLVLMPWIAAAQDKSASGSAEAAAAKAQKRVPHSNLIRIREEYRDKVMQSVDEL